MKNQKGVTLIALVVTIIVLIILAGVAIATLMGDSGPINRAKEAKQSQIRGEVSDQITLAIASAKMLAEKTTVESSGFSASKDLNGANSIILGDLVNELKPGNGYTVTVENSGSDNSKTVTILYQTKAYENAMNEKKSAITVTVTVAGNSFTVSTPDYTTKATNPASV